MFFVYKHKGIPISVEKETTMMVFLNTNYLRCLIKEKR